VNAAIVIASVSAAFAVVFVLWLFVWAARKDGEDQQRRDRYGGRPP
jgi:hypothetical protein